ncbi:MAG: hypothetical protein HYU85_04310 [Chloroflexi bacterium]|nr:hypothetical protein [Chloroflexota bacterium]
MATRLSGHCKSVSTASTYRALAEMGYVTASERESKKVYTITAEGLKFLEEQKEFAERMRSQMRGWWHPENIDDISDAMREFEKLAQLLNVKARSADTEQLRRIRQAISQAYEAISKDQD